MSTISITILQFNNCYTKDDSAKKISQKGLQILW